MEVTERVDPGPTVELEFDIGDRDRFFVDVSTREGCRVDLEHLIRRSDEPLLEFLSVEGAPADRILSLADAGAITRAVSPEAGRGWVVAEVPAHVEVRTVVERFRSRYDDAVLVAQRNREGRCRSAPDGVYERRRATG